MNLTELKKHIDLEVFLVTHGYKYIREKSCHRNPRYSNGKETIVVTDCGNIKLYFCADSDRGSVVDFCKHRPEIVNKYPGEIMQQIRLYLNAYLNLPTQTIPLESHIKVTDRNSDFTLQPNQYIQSITKKGKEFGCLTKRYINRTTLDSEVFVNIGISPNTYGFTNLAFPHYNKDFEIKGLDLRNTNFKQFAENSNRSNSVWLSNFEPFIKEIIFNESPIDSLSHFQLKRPGQKGLLYISSGGSLTKDQIEMILFIIEQKRKINPDLKIVTAFDNDLAGFIYSLKLMTSIIEGQAVIISKTDDTYRKIENLTNPNLKRLLQTKRGATLESGKDNSFNLIYPHNTQFLQELNNSFIGISPIPTQIDLSAKNDWNEELQISQQNKLVEKDDKITQSIKSKF